MTYRFLQPAREEFDKAISYYEHRLDGLGIRFLSAVGSGIDTILKVPTAWAKISKMARRYQVPNFPYGIIYEIEKDEVVIVAVAHSKRRFGYWKKRH